MEKIMATFRGLVHTLEVRDDGWVEVILQAVHMANITQIFYIKNLDGDISVAHKKLAQLSLLRDAITRILPVEINYSDDEKQGRLIDEVMIHPRPSIEGREFTTRVQGVVIGVSIVEIGPNSTTPYQDAPDLAGITLLKEDGSVGHYLLDLQREEALTMHAMLNLLQRAHQNRRPVILLLSMDDVKPAEPGSTRGLYGTYLAVNNPNKRGGYILGCEWVTLEEEVLDYQYAFIERLGQRYESYTETNSEAASHVKVVYTTAPAQTPEGDISENGHFSPSTEIAWVHADSPLLKLLCTALKKRLQVKLGLVEEEFIHEVEVISRLGSAGRPVWICMKQIFCDSNAEKACDNTPTISLPSKSSMIDIPISFSWLGEGYFNEGVWRFQVTAEADYEVRIDGKKICCGIETEDCCCQKERENRKSENEKNKENLLQHAYLHGMHKVQLKLKSYRHSQTFDLKIYRIR
jgi:hypothetical protein